MQELFTLATDKNSKQSDSPQKANSNSQRPVSNQPQANSQQAVGQQKVYNADPLKPALRIITLSGTESVTKNMTVYECGEDIIIVDCGVGFPDSEMLGVDVVIPDMRYLEENSDRIRALIITHGHEDHIGAVPYFLQKFDVPIYANKLVQGFLKEKLKDKSFRSLLDRAKFVLFDPEHSNLTLGRHFSISAFNLNHSVPMSHGIAIKTPQGLVLHMADYKIDWTPVLDKPIDLGTIAMYGKEGVLCLLSDCLGSTHEGYSKSESSLNDTFSNLLDHAENRQFLVTTISSNLSRMHQIIEAAVKHGRKVVLAGRSIDQTVGVGKSLGLLPFRDEDFVKLEEASDYLQKDLVYITAGCYGQQGSALDRISRGEHDHIMLQEEAIVVFSADPNPPGVAEDVERVMNNLTMAGAEVIYGKIQDNLHVSGHGTKGDLITIAHIVHPRYFIPIGGTVTKMRAYSNMLQEVGFVHSQILELMEGESAEFNGGFAKHGPTLEVQKIFVEGRSVGEISPVVMKDRENLSEDGVFVVVVPIDPQEKVLAGKIEVITRGFVYVKENKALLGKSKDMVNKALDKFEGKINDWNAVRNKIEDQVSRYLYKETGRTPVIIVHAIHV